MLEISDQEYRSQYKVYYKDNGQSVEISSDEELSRYILTSLPDSNIYVSRIELGAPSGNSESQPGNAETQPGVRVNIPIIVNFLDTGDET